MRIDLGQRRPTELGTAADAERQPVLLGDAAYGDSIFGNSS